MSIALPADLPAAAVLRAEGAAVDHAVGQGRALRVALVNLMPDRPATETQFARLLAASRHRVSLALAVPAGLVPREGEAEHVARHYRPWPEVAAAGVDAVIVTGALVERLPFAEVRYWPGVANLLDGWGGAAGPHVCWAAQAALWHHHGIPKRALDEKAFGVLPHPVEAPDAAVLAGIGPAADPGPRHTRPTPPTAARATGPARAGVAARCRPVPGRGAGCARPLHAEPSRIRRRHAAAGVSARPGGRAAGAGAGGILPARRCFGPTRGGVLAAAGGAPFQNWLEGVAEVAYRGAEKNRLHRAVDERDVARPAEGRRHVTLGRGIST
jgi:homoserine O-succinyltransferase